jgi:hypothetical protein
LDFQHIAFLGKGIYSQYVDCKKKENLLFNHLGNGQRQN